MVTRSEIISGFSWNTLTVVLQVAIQFVYTGLLARQLTPDAFGLMGIVLGIMGFAEIFSQVGIGPALIQRKEVNQQHINGAFYTALILGLLFTVIFVCSAPAIASIYKLPELENIVKVVCLSFTISALAVVPRSMMMRAMRFRIFFRASMISIIGGNLIVGLLLAHMGYNVWAYVWALLTQNLLMTMTLWYYQATSITANWRWKFTRELIRYGTGSTIFNSLNYLATKLDVMLVPSFMRGDSPSLTVAQLETAGLYERSAYAMSQPITVMGKISDSVLFSGMSKLQDEDSRLRTMMCAAITLLSVCVVPATVFILFFAEEVVRIWLGPQYMGSVTILQIIFIAVIFRVLSKLADSLLRAKNAVFRGSFIKCIYVLLIAGGIWIATIHGMNWVALAIVVATFIHFAMNLWFAMRLIDLSISSVIRSFLPSLWLGIIASLSGLIVYNLSHWQAWPPLVSITAGMFATGAALFLAIYLKPQILGHGSKNILHFIPQSFKSKSLFSKMMARL